MLRALGVPAVLGAPGVLGAVRPGTPAIIDGDTGEIILNPSPASLERGPQQNRRPHPHPPPRWPGCSACRRKPATVTIELQANLELPFELPHDRAVGRTGIGLLRSEFMFMNRESLPDEDAQTRI